MSHILVTHFYEYLFINPPELWSSSSWFPKISSFPIRGLARLAIIELSDEKNKNTKIKFISIEINYDFLQIYTFRHLLVSVFLIQQMILQKRSHTVRNLRNRLCKPTNCQRWPRQERQRTLIYSSSLTLKSIFFN